MKLLYSYKTLSLIIGLLLVENFAKAADRYSVAMGNWNSTTTWSETSGGASGASVPVEGDVVYIEGGKNVTVSVNAACASIFFTITTSSSLTINPGISLTVTLGIEIPGAINGDNKIVVGDGSLNAENINFSNGSVISSGHMISISTGTLNVKSAISGTSNKNSGTILFTGPGLLRLGGSIFTPLDGKLTTFEGCTIEYYAEGEQVVEDFSYVNLKLSGSGAKLIDSGTSISRNLSIGGAKASINNSENITIGSLTLGGLYKINGTWGSTTSSATNSDDSYFGATTGYLSVTDDGPVVITGQTTGSQTQCLGGSFTAISVTARGEGLTYQWYSNTSASTTSGVSLESINGAQTNVYMPQTTFDGSLYYYCIIKGYVGSATSMISGELVVIPTVEIPVFSFGETSSRVQGAGMVTYTSSAAHSTGLLYTLDAASLAGGNVIDKATGQITYVSSWIGTSVITATAEGCNGPKKATHTAVAIILTLGSSSGYALFTSVGALSNTGASIITGDVGTNAGAFTGFSDGTLTGQSNIANATSLEAATDLTKSFNDLAGISCGTNLGATIGNGQTLTPNVYCLNAESQINGELTLDAQGDPNAFFIFKIDGAFSTSALSKVILINSASLCNVYWQVEGAINIGAGSVFNGTIVAGGAINLFAGSTLLGRGLTTAGAIAIFTSVVNFKPVAPGPITGNSKVCPEQKKVSYSIAAIPNTIGYVWTIPAGATIASGLNTNSIEVDFGTSGGDITVRGTNNCGNGIISEIYKVSVLEPPEKPVFTIGATSTNCLGATKVIYTATAANATEITFSLDEVSISAGNRIIAATGEVTYVEGWEGPSTITAIATGCGLSSTSTHTMVTTTSIAGIPIFTLGATASRCQGEGSVTYTATVATNNFGITYSLDAASLAGGNSINVSTGEVAYVAVWDKTCTITASSAGCPGPAIATLSATIIPNGASIEFTLGTKSTRSQGAGFVTYSNASNKFSGIEYSLDEASHAGGNSIDTETGIVNYSSGWVGTSIITARAEGCNGQISGVHSALSIALKLGTTSDFALFTVTGNVSNTGASVVTGNVGTNVGTLTGFPIEVLTGQIHVADDASVLASANATTAYTDLTAVASGALIGNPLGNGLVLTPNVYSIGAALTLNGDVTLDGQGDPNALFIFKLGGALVTNDSSKVILINSASLCNVYWQVNGAVTLGKGSVFRGTIVANGAINILDKASLFGRALSVAGLISLNNNVVNFIPAAAGTITGSSTVCQGQKGVAYSVPEIANAADYQWILPDGAKIASGFNTRSITVDFCEACGNITVQGVSGCGVGKISPDFEVTTIAPVAQTITGETPLCSVEGSAIWTGTTAGGSWSSATSGVATIDASTGLVTGVSAGTSVITYTVTTFGSCVNIVTKTVTVNALPVANFSFTGTPYYSNAANPLPTISDGGVAGTFSSTEGLNFVNTSTGEVNIASSSLGSYSVMNTIEASGGCGIVTATSPISIIHFPMRVISTSAGGDWAVASTWVGNIVPFATDTVVIATTDAGNVTTFIGEISCAGITINGGSVLNMNKPFIVNGETNVTGTLNFGSTDETSNLMTFNGTVTLNNSSIWNETTTGTVPSFTFTNNFTNNSATFTTQAGSHTFTGDTMTLNGTNANSMSNVIISGAYTNNGNLSIGNLLTGTGCLINGITGVLSLGGTSTINTLTATSEGNTIRYTGVEQTVIPIIYSNLILLGSGIKTLPGTSLSILGDFSLLGIATATLAGMTTVEGNLTIGNGTILSISPAINLTVLGTLINYAGTSGFVLQSDQTGTASLIHNTNNVHATVQRYISGAAEAWHLLSSPVADQGISGSWLPPGNYGDNTRTGKGTGYDMYLWDEPSNCWIYKLNPGLIVNWNSLNPGIDFVVGRGYLYSLEATNQTKEFKGILNNGSVSYSLARGIVQSDLNGFNLIGNPYPSSIDWSASSGWIRSNLVNSGSGYDMWIWNPSANNYGVYNSFTLSGTNDVTQYIAPMQGYFVRALSGGNLTMDNSVRIANAAGNWKNAVIKPDKLSVIVQSTSDNSFDEVELLFGYNKNQMGAAKLFSHVVTAPSLYIPWADQYYSVRYLTDTVENPTVPVMFKPGRDGNYTLTGRFDFDQFKMVILEDCQAKVMQNLKTSQTYHFNATKTDNNNRFRLHFGTIKNLPIIELPATISTDGTNILIDLTLVQKETEVFVYDILGRIVLNKKLQGGIKHILKYNATTQLLIVCLRNREGNLYQKLFLEMK